MSVELDPPVSGGGRGRRPRRTVITDDNYGDEGYLGRDGDAPPPRAPEGPALAKARAAASRAQAPKRAASAVAPAPLSSGRVVWRLAGLATFMWLGGVLAFAAGYFQLPLDPIDALPRAAMTLPPHLLLMTGAIALAPLGLIWLTALSARRADALRAETAALADRIGASGGVGAGVESGAEAGLEAAADRLRQEREAVERLLEELEGGADRLSGSLADMRKGAAGGEPRPRAERSTVGLEPKNMLAGDPRRVEPPRAEPSRPDLSRVEAARAEASRADPMRPEPIDDDELDEEGEEFTPALGPERSAPSAPAARVKIGESAHSGARGAAYGGVAGGGNGRARQQLQEIDRLKARVDGGRSAGGAAAAVAPPAPSPRQGSGGALDWGKLISAANFPESEDDQETLDALYAVLTDTETAALLQSAEDALSGLADIGLFMEDMQPHHAPADLWRAYIVDGGKVDVMDIGGIRDPHAIEDTSEALRSKPDFAKTAERFMDRYETMVERLFAEAPEPAMVVELADTRSGRAFMLLARASGRLG